MTEVPSSAFSSPAPRAPALLDFVRVHRGAILSTWRSETRAVNDSGSARFPAVIDAVIEALEARMLGTSRWCPMHPIEHLDLGVDIDAIVADLGALRRAVVMEWSARVGGAPDADELLALEGTIDDAIAAAAVHFAAGERRARREALASLAFARRAAGRMELLDEATRALSSAKLDVQELLDTVCGELCRHIADLAIVTLACEAQPGMFRIESVAATDDNVAALLRSLAGPHGEVRSGTGIAANVIARGTPLVLPRVEEGELDTLANMVGPAWAGTLRALAPSSFVALPLRAPDGAVVGALTVARLEGRAAFDNDDVALMTDVANRAAAAVANARSYKAAQDEAKTREEIMAIVGHDLRNPLSAISLAAQGLMGREDLDDRTRKTGARIASASERATRIIEDLLDASRLRASGLTLQRSDVDLVALARGLVEELRELHPGRTVSFSYEGDCSGAWDPARIAQVVTNLVGNALEHSPADSDVSVALQGRADDVVLDVTNAGPPIPPELLARIFEPFQRGPSSSAGLGLGLYITDQIVSAHGGTTTARSDDGGTAFRVILPRS